MPLPADGAVLGYTIRIGEWVIRGEIEPRDKAEATYKEALYSGARRGSSSRIAPTPSGSGSATCRRARTSDRMGAPSWSKLKLAEVDDER
jgi:hypothetical protein